MKLYMLLSVVVCAVTVATSAESSGTSKYPALIPQSHYCPPLDVCMETKSPNCETEFFTDSLGCDRCRCNYPPLPTCTDKRDNCGYWSQHGYCSDPEYSIYMMLYCAKSCNICSSGEPKSHHCPPLEEVCMEMEDPDCEIEFFTDSLGCDRCRCKDPLPTPPPHFCPPLDICFEMEGPDCEIEFFTDHGCSFCRCKAVDPTPSPDLCHQPKHHGPWCWAATTTLYFYNTETRACEAFPNFRLGPITFGYAPCHADTRNTFETLQECQMTCLQRERVNPFCPWPFCSP